MGLEDIPPKPLFELPEMPRKSPEERYILKDAAELLGISVSALYKWLVRAGLREVVEQQIDEGDNRARYLTAGQVQMLAKIHRRKLPPIQQDLPLPFGPQTGAAALASSVAMPQGAESFERSLFPHEETDWLKWLQDQTNGAPDDEITAIMQAPEAVEVFAAYPDFEHTLPRFLKEWPPLRVLLYKLAKRNVENEGA